MLALSLLNPEHVSERASFTGIQTIRHSFPCIDATGHKHSLVAGEPAFLQPLFE